MAAAEAAAAEAARAAAAEALAEARAAADVDNRLRELPTEGRAAVRVAMTAVQSAHRGHADRRRAADEAAAHAAAKKAVRARRDARELRSKVPSLGDAVGEARAEAEADEADAAAGVDASGRKKAGRLVRGASRRAAPRLRSDWVDALRACGGNAGRLLATVTAWLLRSADVSELVDATRAACAEIFGAVRVTLWQIDSQTQQLRSVLADDDLELPATIAMVAARGGGASLSIAARACANDAVLREPARRDELPSATGAPPSVLDDDGARYDAALVAPIHDADGDVIGALALLDRRAPGGGAPDVFAERDALTLASVIVPVGLVLGALAPANAERDNTVDRYAGHALERGR